MEMDGRGAHWRTGSQCPPAASRRHGQTKITGRASWVRDHNGQALSYVTTRLSPAGARPLRRNTQSGQLTLNQRVQGSSPCAPTRPIKGLGQDRARRSGNRGHHLGHRARRPGEVVGELCRRPGILPTPATPGAPAATLRGRNLSKRNVSVPGDAGLQRRPGRVCAPNMAFEVLARLNPSLEKGSRVRAVIGAQ
jgi:hypothetical protein